MFALPIYILETILKGTVAAIPSETAENLVSPINGQLTKGEKIKFEPVI